MKKRIFSVLLAYKTNLLVKLHYILYFQNEICFQSCFETFFISLLSVYIISQLCYTFFKLSVERGTI